MHCPNCKDEFRPGFTRCASCDVDLVDDLSEVESASAAQVPSEPSGGIVRMTDYCGYLSLEDARDGRDQVRSAGIGCEITIREAPESDPDGPVTEEFWLRVETALYAKAVAALGFDAAQDDTRPEEDLEEFDCGACGRTVAAHETLCPHCGARFDDD